MNARHVALLSLAIAAVVLILFAAHVPAQAQGQPPALKVATASASKIFLGIKEMHELQAKFKEELANLDKESRARQQKVADLRGALELIKPEAPQYEEQSRAYMQAASDQKAWVELNQGLASRKEKLQTKMLFDKITATIAEVAKERGIDFVVSEPPALNIDRMSSQDLTQAMAQREILYSNASLDLTADVIARLDERYAGAKH